MANNPGAYGKVGNCGDIDSASFPPPQSPARVRTWSRLIQSEACCQLHHRAMAFPAENPTGIVS